jgi:hypothetical protein
MIVGPELWWNEPDFAVNVIIRNNTFVNTGLNSGPAILISNDDFAVQGNKNITIEGNTFIDNYSHDIIIRGAQNVIIKDNIFGLRHPGARPAGEDMNQNVWMENLDGVSFSGNTFPDGRVSAGMADSVTNLTGLEISGFNSSSAAMSSVQGNNGWYWQYAALDRFEADAYINYDFFGADNERWWLGSANTFGTGMVAGNRMHPGGSVDAVKTYVVSRDGAVALSSVDPILTPDASSDGTMAKVLVNDVVVWPPDGGWQFIPPNVRVPMGTVTVDVKAGDRIHFRLNKNVTTSFDSTVWDPVVTYR